MSAPSALLTPLSDRTWWKEAIVYQVYLRSFQDSNGDGIGDIPGLISRLDHIRALGADAIWICPHYDSPDVDNGYDIRDYRKVHQDFGTMEDFERLVAEMTARGMRLIIDLVANHTSDQHEWFRQSRLGPDNPYRNYYIWRDGTDDASPNNYVSFFSTPAWTRDSVTGQYYLHYFTPQQPDLNWENPDVRREIHDIMRFWLDKGVSGFRLDAIPYISKPEGLPDLTPEQMRQPDRVYASGPHLHLYLRDIYRDVLDGRDLMTVGEAGGVTFEQTPLFVSAARKELDMIFHFEVSYIGRDGWRSVPWTLPYFKKLVSRETRSSGPDGWDASFLENHDLPRSVSKLGDDTPDGHTASAKALATLLLLRKGTAYIYQGEEIGMTNLPFNSIDDFDDIDAHNIWQATVGSGTMTPEEVLPQLSQNTRDNARSPMQWDDSAQADFTTGAPWFRVNPNHDRINVAQQENDPASILSYYRALIGLRRANPALIYGEFADIDPHHHAVFAFTRTIGTERFLALINMTGETQPYAPIIPITVIDTLLVSGSPTQNDVLPETLTPWHAGLYRIAPE